MSLPKPTTERGQPSKELIQETKERDQKRREGRKKGRLSQSLQEKLQSCNPEQLKRVIKLSRQYLRDHKLPPDIREVPNVRNARILAYVVCKNKLYWLEVHPCSKPNCKKILTVFADRIEVKGLVVKPADPVFMRVRDRIEGLDTQLI